MSSLAVHSVDGPGRGGARKRAKRGHPIVAYLSAIALAVTLPIVMIFSIALAYYVHSERANLRDTSHRALAVLQDAVSGDLGGAVDALRAAAAASDMVTDAALFRRHAAQSLAQSRYQGEIMLLDATGHDASGEEPIGPLPEGSWASLDAQLARSGQAISGLLTIDGGARRVAIAVPAPTASGVRALVLFLKPERFTQLIVDFAARAPIASTLLDAGGHIIVRSRDSVRLQGATLDGFSQVIGSKGDLDRLDLEGKPARTVFARLPTSGWVVLAQYPLDALNAPLWRGLRWFALVVVVLLATAVPLFWSIINRMRGAIRAVADAAHELGRSGAYRPSRTALAETNALIEVMASASDALHMQSEGLATANHALRAKVAERTSELVESRSISQVILDSSTDHIKLLDCKGAILFVNKAAQCDVCAAGPNGISWPDLWPPEGASQAAEAIVRAQRNLSTRFEAARRVGEGKERWFDVMVSPVRIDETTTHILAVSRDVTAHHDMDETLRRAKQKAERATLAKTEFVADLSHELRAPLTAILAYTDMLEADPTLTDEQRSRVLRIENAAIALLTLAQELLDVAQIENGEAALQSRAFSLATVIDEAIMLEAPSAEAKGLALTVETHGSVGFSLRGDPDRLRQIILNLVGNAIKFTPQGSVTLSIRVEPAEACTRHVVIAIRDTGIGMPAEKLSLLCQRFSGNDVFSGVGSRGAGLGLAIVERLVTRMGGRLSVASQPSVGSTFEVSLILPVVEDASVPATSLSPAKPFLHARILVAEDVPVRQAATRALLETLGCQVDVVSGGRAAVAAVETKPYDLVLMDEQLDDDVSGTQAARAIRELAHPLNAVPIVSCSGQSLLRGWQGYADAGMSGRMDKPSSVARLAETLRQYLPVPEYPVDGGMAPTAPDGPQCWLPEHLVEPAKAQLHAELTAWTSIDLAAEGGASLARKAHRLLSTARVLGLMALAERCERFEEAVGADVGIEAALMCLNDAVRQAFRHCRTAAPGPRTRSPRAHDNAYESHVAATD